jgi:putative methionine-R-sulfoxide reductase with GAF domain
MCIQASTPMPMNRLLPLVLDLSETGARIHTTGHVVWSEPSGRTGIRFPEFPEASLLQLQEWFGVNAAAGADSHSDISEDQNRVLDIRTIRTRPAAASGYTSLVNEWAEISSQVELFGPELDSALHLIAQRALSLTWASGAAIALMNKLKPSELICRARAGNDSPEIGARLQAGSGFSGECVRAATSLKCDDAQTDHRVDRRSCRALGIRSLIACPVKRKTGEVIGILEVFSPEAGAFWDNDTNVLERLARIIADAVGRAEHSRPDILAVHPPEDDLEPNLFADALQSLREESLAHKASSFSRKVFLLMTGLVALTATIWLVAPWVADSIAKIESGSRPQAAEASALQNSYANTSFKDLRKLALSGDPAAQYSLGLRYASGDGIRQDYREAISWFSKSANQGDVRAAPKLAAFYWAGRGATKDYSKAYFWGLLAQAAGDETGRVIVMSSAPFLTPASIARQQQQADKWLHDHHIVGQSSSDSD